MTSADLLLLAASRRQTASATGRRLTLPGTTFVIADSANAKGFGDYGSCLTSQAVFTSGRSATRKANRITTARKSQRHWRQLRRKVTSPPLIHNHDKLHCGCAAQRREAFYHRTDLNQAEDIPP